MGSPLGPRLMGRSEGGGAVMGRTLTRLRPPPDRPAPSSSSSKPPPPPGEPGLLAGVLPTPVPEASSGSLPEAHRKCRSGGSSPASCLFIDTSMDLSSLSEPSPSSSPWKRLYRRISRSSFRSPPRTCKVPSSSLWPQSKSTRSMQPASGSRWPKNLLWERSSSTSLESPASASKGPVKLLSFKDKYMTPERGLMCSRVPVMLLEINESLMQRPGASTVHPCQRPIGILSSSQPVRPEPVAEFIQHGVPS
mmetsp:Transcript_58998/g.133604  ORF Transcript_58998/g.133604 Transcript_58998/m.133604 type:complete len:250 (+) Transcript_58998:323-1072(+)